MTSDELTFELPALMNDASTLTDTQLKTVAGGTEDSGDDTLQEEKGSCDKSCWFNSC